ALEKDVASKAVDDDHVYRACSDVFAFDVADVVDWQRPNQRDRFGQRGVALTFFFAVGQGRHAGPLFAQGDLGVDAAHERELGEPVRPDVDVGAGIEQDGRAFERG